MTAAKTVADLRAMLVALPDDEVVAAWVVTHQVMSEWLGTEVTADQWTATITEFEARNSLCDVEEDLKEALYLSIAEDEE